MFVAHAPIASRTISLIALPLVKDAWRIRATVITTSISPLIPDQPPAGRHSTAILHPTASGVFSGKSMHATGVPPGKAPGDLTHQCDTGGVLTCDR
ncbi:hypothetical protein [Sphingomonas hankookensis]|uniref:hypothetical protein n=1 Tax=Sphingomonas hankookensis TaxID=563996 RepID=UPI003D302114